MALMIADRHARVPGVHRWVVRACVPLSLSREGWFEVWVLFECPACQDFVEYVGEITHVEGPDAVIR